MKLSILIPSIAGRYYQRTDLLNALKPQLTNEVEVITETDRGEMSIGHKRNILLDKAKGDYVCFIDDDDMVVRNYVSLLMEGIDKGVDCCSLMGVITWDGVNPEIFEHSIKYKEYKTAPPTSGIKYERYPNHLNCIKSEIAKQFRFLEINHGEDTDWATQIFKSGLLKTEHYINNVLYEYKYKEK